MNFMIVNCSERDVRSYLLLVHHTAYIDSQAYMDNASQVTKISLCEHAVESVICEMIPG